MGRDLAEALGMSTSKFFGKCSRGLLVLDHKRTGGHILYPSGVGPYWLPFGQRRQN